MTRKLFLAGLVAGLLIGTVAAQTPPAPAPPVVPVVPVTPPAPAAVTITGATSVPCYGFLRFEVSGTFKSAFWFTIPKESSGADIVSEYTSKTWHGPGGASGSSYVLGGSPGKYTVRCIVSDAQGDQQGFAVNGEILLPVSPTPAPPAPNPTPVPPGPIPTPTPTPPRPFPSTQLRRPFPSSWLPARELARG